jgi:hypothetical protein
MTTCHATHTSQRLLGLGLALALALGLSLATAAPAYAEARLDGPDVPAVTDAEMQDALGLAGTNRAELQAALDYCQQQPFTMEAMRFIVANLPLSDLGCVTSGELLEHVELAMEAWFNEPYGKDVSPEDWAHYVLAPRVSQEPLAAWRPYFKQELEPVVAGCATLEDAAVKVNYWCGERVKFVQTQRRDQDALATLTSGYGRCEEMAIFFICACRSVGIPARQAYCPWWSWGDNNHAWVEVLGSDGRWHFAGGCEPAEKLDQAWFGDTVKQAPLICSMCFGLPAADAPGLLRYETAPGARWAQFNSTPEYRQTGRVEVSVPGATAGDFLYVYVYNYGALRGLAKLTLDEQGRAGVNLGAGLYALSCSADVDPPVVLVRAVDGETRTVSWDELTPLAEGQILTYPKDMTGVKY